jgi:hypothetical protein
MGILLVSKSRQFNDSSFIAAMTCFPDLPSSIAVRCADANRISVYYNGFVLILSRWGRLASGEHSSAVSVAGHTKEIVPISKLLVYLLSIRAHCNTTLTRTFF